MLKQAAAIATIAITSLANAYAAVASVEEEREFPLAIVFALIAVFISVGVVVMGARSKKKD